MERVEASILIRATPAEVFDLAQDYELRLEWDPFLKSMEFRDGAVEAAVGVRVGVRAKNGLSMEVVYVSLTRPRVVAMKMVRGPWFFQPFAGTWRFEAAGPDETRVTFIYAFEVRRPVRLVATPLIRWSFGRDIRSRLQGLKRGAESPDLIARIRAPRDGQSTSG